MLDDDETVEGDEGKERERRATIGGSREVSNSIFSVKGRQESNTM